MTTIVFLNRCCRLLPIVVIDQVLLNVFPTIVIVSSKFEGGCWPLESLLNVFPAISTFGIVSSKVEVG